MQFLTQFLGRLHPLVVHLPIGFLFMAGIFEFLSYFSRYRKLRQAVQPALLLGAVMALAAVGSGYLLSGEGGYEDRLLMLHRNTGFATAAFAWILVFIRKSAVTFFQDKGKRKLIRIFLFIPMTGLLSLTGHLGGSLTHGEGYLLDFSSDENESGTPIFKLTAGHAPDSAIVYRDMIEPILHARCYGCHSATKQKGQLRLDQISYILKGGKHGVVIDGSIPDSSSLYSRLMLPLEDEHHMPPNEKPQLPSSEIALIQTWIEEGADFKKQLGTFRDAAKIKGYLSSLLDQATVQSLIPTVDVPAASPKAVAVLAAAGVLVIPVGAETNYLSVSFVNARAATDKELELLLPIKDQLVWLNLGRTKITDNGLDRVSKLSNLTQLNLEYTAIEDRGLEKLKSLTQLTSLNLVGTKIGDVGLQHLSSHAKLKKLFLYQTKVTAAGVTSISQSLQGVETDTGQYQLPPLVTDTLIFKSAR